MWVKLGVFLLSMCGSLAARVLVSLGIGTVSYFALNTLASQLIAHVVDSTHSMGNDVLNLLNMCGFGAAISIICSGIITKAGLMAVQKMTSTTLSNGAVLPRW